MCININSKLKIALLLMLFIVSGGIFAQNISVSGVITDSQTGEPIIGVSVTVKGTTTGTFSDENGRYSIPAARNNTLTFSFLGYETKEVPATSEVINMTLISQDFQIDEIVVVGAAFKKSDLTGAVGSVSGKVLEEKPVTTINQAIQGRVAGVFISNGTRPGDDATIKIRGTNTINTSSDPIYVVDGLVMDNFASGFNSINLNDVASIEILKDASATALYGSRGANGVVLITTKKGKAGEGRVTYDAWFGIQEFAKVPKTMKTKDLFELRRDAYINGYKADNPNASQADIDAYTTNKIMGSNLAFADYEFDAYNNNRSYNWLDEVTRTGFQQNHTLSFTGGSDKNSYYMSFNYSDLKGLMKTSGQTKYSGRINADQQIKSWLKVGTNTTFTRIKDQIVDDGVLNRARNANVMFPIDEEVPTLDYKGVFDENNFNPIRSLKVDQNRTRNRILTSNYLNINPIKGLNIRTSLSVDYVEEKEFKYTPKDIYESIRYSQDGEAKHKRDSRTVWQWDNTVSYETAIGKHNINGLLGTSSTRTDRNWTELTAKGFADDFYHYHNIGSSYKKDEREIGSGFVTSAMMSYIARFNYNYDNKYYLTATARYDGSSRFGDGHRWGLFPSFSGAWNIAQEDFMKDQKIFDQLKLRLGYGIAGNQNIDDYAFLSLYTASVSNNEGSIVAPDRRGTKDIGWEKQRQFNAGIDMAFLNNKIRFSVDGFIIKNKDLLMKRPLSTSSGFKEAFVNIGAIENKGMEFSLAANIVETKDFAWNVSANLSFDKNKVTKLMDGNNVIYKMDGSNIEKEGNLFVGESRNTIYVWKNGGIASAADIALFEQMGMNWNGRQVNPGDLYPVDANGDKVIDQNDRVVIGSTDPKFYGGFATDFSWKGISLNAVFSYSYGAKKLSPYYEGLISSTGSSIASMDLLNRWSETNTNGKFPRPIADAKYNTFNVGHTDFAVQNASYLRLSTLTLAYNFPSNLVSRLKLSNLRVYATGSNLFCATSYKGYDPETGDWYPPTRMYVFGLNVSF